MTAHTPPPATTRELLQELATFRTIYALCDLRRTDDGGEILNASHYAICLTAGNQPLWAVLSARTGRIDRWAGSRAQIEEAFPRKSWRKKTSTWSLDAVGEHLERAEIVRLLKAQKAPA